MKNYTKDILETSNFILGYEPSEVEGFLDVYYASGRSEMHPSTEETIKRLENALAAQFNKYISYEDSVLDKLQMIEGLAVTSVLTPTVVLGSKEIFEHAITSGDKALVAVCAVGLVSAGKLVRPQLDNYFDFLKNLYYLNNPEVFEALDLKDERITKGISDHAVDTIKERLDKNVPPINLGSMNEYSIRDIIKITKNYKKVLKAKQKQEQKGIKPGKISMKPLGIFWQN